ncbi:Transcriptional regulator, GntR family [Olavius sp. associated proteobacterium Delta 1]|nr:Transcriptional regulator, GntR family [Olavius sp. associated proteobacterium Delta 1]
MKKLVIRPSKKIREKVYEHLREGILNGEIKAGDRLIESKLADNIGTSRTPVREALHTLEREGLVESIHRVGYVVRPISEVEVSELCEIRLALEALALRWALSKDPAGLANAMKENLSLCEKRIAEGDLKAFVELDAQFHELISRIADSSRLREMTNSIRRYMLRYRIQSIYTEENVRRAVTGHQSVLKAIEDGDKKAAQRALRAHIKQSKEDILYFDYKDKTSVS